MSATTIPTALRALVRARAKLQCEYCGLEEEATLLPHEPDHIIAIQHGGTTDSENLALACFDCNRLKGPNLSSLDPLTRTVEPLFNPRADPWADHFQLRGALIVPLTAKGRATAALLRFNSPEHIRQREAIQNSKS